MRFEWESFAIYLWEVNQREGRKLFSPFYHQHQQQTNDVKWIADSVQYILNFAFHSFGVLSIPPAAADQWCEVECRFSADSVHHRLQWKCNVSGLVKCNCNAQCISEETNTMQYSTLQWSCCLPLAVQWNKVYWACHPQCNTGQRNTKRLKRNTCAHLARYSAIQCNRAEYSDVASRPHSILCTLSPLQSK